MPKKRVDSAHEMAKIMAGAFSDAEPPQHLNLRQSDFPFWKAIIDARAEWTDVDLAHAANLARCQADIETLQKSINAEGDIIQNKRGTPIMNPKHTLLETLSRRSVALSRMIQVHAAATIGEAKLSRAANKAKREALDVVNDVEDDDLIAKPMH